MSGAETLREMGMDGDGDGAPAAPRRRRRAEYTSASSGAATRTAALTAVLTAGAFAGALAGAFASAGAQVTRAADTVNARVAAVGGVADDRRRVLHLLGQATPDGLLLRSPSSAGAGPARGARFLAPELLVVHSTALAVPMNDGALWTGRGTSALVRAGVDARWGPLRVVLLPEVTASQNRAFDVRPDTFPGRAAYAWPWSNGRANIDLPSRFGDRPWRLISPGQSSVTIEGRGVAAGVATENEWWGPGVRNALLLSNAAEGFPHAFARTRRPLRTRLGDVEARYLFGVLTPSIYSDSAVTRRWRSFSAVAATLRPRIAPGLTLGAARAVVAPLRTVGAAAGHAVDAVVEWQAPPADTTRRLRADQYTSLFARWAVPEARAEFYAEWAKQVTPRSLRELLLFPQDGRALTMGMQLLRPIDERRGRVLRTQLELSSVEQSIVLRDRPAPPPFYAGLAVPDGYTHRGQPLGASFGPGGSSQWLAVELLGRAAGGGLFLTRTRWNNDALYDQPNPTFLRHDVSLTAGARGTWRGPAADIGAELHWTRRNNYLFQNGFANPGGVRTVDVPNVLLLLRVTPR